MRSTNPPINTYIFIFVFAIAFFMLYQLFIILDNWNYILQFNKSFKTKRFMNNIAIPLQDTSDTSQNFSCYKCNGDKYVVGLNRSGNLITKLENPLEKSSFISDTKEACVTSLTNNLDYSLVTYTC